MDTITQQNQARFENLLLERRLIEALKMLLDNADWDSPVYNHKRCCLFIANTRRFLAMQPQEIATGGGTRGQSGNYEKYDLVQINNMLKQAIADRDKYGPVQNPFATIDFGVEQNARGYFY